MRSTGYLFAVLVCSLVFSGSLSPARAYIPIVSEIVVGSLIAGASARRDRRRFERVDDFDHRGSRSSLGHPVIEAEGVQLSNRIEDYLGADLNLASKYLLTRVVDLVDSDSSVQSEAVESFLRDSLVVEFIKAVSNPGVDFEKLVYEMPFYARLSELGHPSDVMRFKINRLLGRLGVSQAKLKRAAQKGELDDEFLLRMGSSRDNQNKIIAAAIDLAAWANISPRAMILRGLSESESEAAEERQRARLEKSVNFLKGIVDAYMKFLPKSRREAMMNVMMKAKRENLDHTDTIVLLLQQVGPVVLKRLQEGDISSPELNEALRVFFQDIPPMDWETVETIILRDHQLSRISDGFVEFERTPVAAGTVAQVHRAKVYVEEELVEVAVKVWRPGFDQEVIEDISILNRGESLITQYVNPKAFRDYIEQAGNTLRREGDPETEAENIRKGYETYHDPDNGFSSLELVELNGRSHTRYTLITKFIEGPTLAKIDRSSKREILGALKALSSTYAYWLDSMINQGKPLMHGDLHPGNLKLLGGKSSSKGEFSVAFLDFGNIAELTLERRSYIKRFIEGYLFLDVDLFSKGSGLDAASREVLGKLLKQRVPLSEVLEAFLDQMGNTGLSTFKGFIQFKRVIAQVENELRSLRFSYEARGGSRSDFVEFEPLMIYRSVLGKHGECSEPLE